MLLENHTLAIQDGESAAIMHVIHKVKASAFVKLSLDGDKVNCLEYEIPQFFPLLLTLPTILSISYVPTTDPSALAYSGLTPGSAWSQC